MQIEKHSVSVNRLENPSIQAASVRNIASNGSSSEVSISDLTWLDRQLDLNRENQNSLQEKIISLYEVIEKKTIKNIEMKKNNQVLKGQVQAYLSIIQKIQKASQTTRNFNLQNIPTSETHRSSRQSFRNSYDHEDSKTQIEYAGNFNQYDFVNQTFHRDQDQNTTPHEEMNIYKNLEWERNSIGQFKDENKTSQNSTPITSITNLRMDKSAPHPGPSGFKYKMRNDEQACISNYSQSYCNNRQDQQRAPRKNSQRRPPVNYNKNFEYSEAINNSDCPFPRPSIDMNVKKFSSPNKSFLKKTSTQNLSTGNLVSKYSSIDIESLWNESKSPNTKFVSENNCRLNTGPSKFQLSTFREDKYIQTTNPKKSGRMRK